MPHHYLERKQIRFHSLKERDNKVDIRRDPVQPGDPPAQLSPVATRLIRQAATDIRRARASGRPVILCFGAHCIKNGLAPVLIELVNQEAVTHLATNGAGVIHDWEFAFQGASSEDVRANIARGRFGIWAETGTHLNLALAVGAWTGLGYGEAVGALIADEGLEIPAPDVLKKEAAAAMQAGAWERAAAALDLLSLVTQFDLSPGRLAVPHPYRAYSIQAAAHRCGTPFTAHPMFGHDIIYTHPMNQGAAVGRAAERDFLSFAHSVSRLQGGIYLSVGSAVMSPMIFEKSLSMARNIAQTEGRRIDDFTIYVVDLTPSTWDWQAGEPTESDPAYYLRFMKTFSRMGGRMHYICAHNRDFLLSLCQETGRGRGASPQEEAC